MELQLVACVAARPPCIELQQLAGRGAGCNTACNTALHPGIAEVQRCTRVSMLSRTVYSPILGRGDRGHGLGQCARMWPLALYAQHVPPMDIQAVHR